MNALFDELRDKAEALQRVRVSALALGFVWDAEREEFVHSITGERGVIDPEAGFVFIHEGGRK